MAGNHSNYKECEPLVTGLYKHKAYGRGVKSLERSLCIYSSYYVRVHVGIAIITNPSRKS